MNFRRGISHNFRKEKRAKSLQEGSSCRFEAVEGKCSPTAVEEISF